MAYRFTARRRAALRKAQAASARKRRKSGSKKSLGARAFGSYVQTENRGGKVRLAKARPMTKAQKRANRKALVKHVVRPTAGAIARASAPSAGKYAAKKLRQNRKPIVDRLVKARAR